MSAKHKLTEPENGPDEVVEFDVGQSFDFAQLVSVAQVNWMLLVTAIQPVADLNLALRNLAHVLPKYVVDEADPELCKALDKVLQAQQNMLDGLRVASAANREIKDAFDDLQKGLIALRCMNMVAGHSGYGTA